MGFQTRTMTTTSFWSAPPDALGMFDAAVVRCIAGEVPDDDLLWTTASAGVDLKMRLEVLISKHFSITWDALRSMNRRKRRRMANAILVAELDERETAPADLVPLRPLGGH